MIGGYPGTTQPTRRVTNPEVTLMSDRTIAVLLTVAIFTLLVVWVPALCCIECTCRSVAQRFRASRREKA